MATLNADLKFKRGDAKHYRFRVLIDDAPETPLVLTGSVIRASVKEDAEDPNNRAKVFATSYDTRQIEVTNAVNGEFTWHLQKTDTSALDPGCYPYDVELTGRGVQKTEADDGTITVAPGSKVVTGAGTNFALVEVGDILVPAGTTAPNQRAVVVTRIISATSLETDYDGWAAEAGVAFTVYVGDVKTLACGNVVLGSDVTR